MDTSKKTAIVVGVLFLTAMVTSILGGGMIEPILTDPEGLGALSAHQTQLVSGIMLELVNAIAVVGIGVLMFPILRKYAEAMALGYVGLRIVEAVIQVAGDAIPLALLAASRENLAGMGDTAALQASSVLWIAARGQLVGTLLGLFFGLGALLFYAVLIRSRLVPGWLSIWGLIGAVLILAWNLSETFGIEMSFGMILALPMILNEITLGFWLIFKGFNASAITQSPVQQVRAGLV
jgi:hypothetical protein